MPRVVVLEFTSSRVLLYIHVSYLLRAWKFSVHLLAPSYVIARPHQDKLFMCIFTSSVAEVKKTRIFVCPLAQGRQLTVYQNTVVLDGAQQQQRTTAMILPFPLPGNVAANHEDGVPLAQMVDLSHYKGNIFDDLDADFPILRSNGDDGSRGATLGFATKGVAPPPLAVFKCGSYQYSVAHSLADIDRLQTNVFRVAQDVQVLLSKHYATNYGFLVCICDKTGEYEPIAYTHPMLHGSILFAPTMHDHHENASSSAYADWDHVIYTMNDVEPGVTRGIRSIKHTTLEQEITLQNVSSSVGAMEGQIALPAQVMAQLQTAGVVGLPTNTHRLCYRRYMIRGSQRNGDLTFRTTTWLEQVSSRGCTREVTGQAYFVQPWYECFTCGLVDNNGLCANCRFGCHNGHDVRFRQVSPFFCDCSNTHTHV